MSKQFRSYANKALFCALGLFLLLLPHALFAYKAEDFNWIPPFLARDEKPSIIIIFDNSGSMLGRAYSGSFNASREYYGYFDPKTYYSYNNPTGTDNDYFYPNNASGTWNGNWLNWATMHRVDVARKVMGGGNYISGYGYYEVVTQDTGNRVADFQHNGGLYTDLNGTPNKRMTPHTSSFWIEHPNSALYMIVDGSYYRMRVLDNKKTGVLDAFKDKARMALFIYDLNP